MNTINSNTPVVCIGASAGGLEAIERFFENCPNDLGVSYVVIQHLSSQYKSMMDDLINRYSSMPVEMIRSGVSPVRNTIYLIEAGTIVELKNGCFKVSIKKEGELTLPIDIFLCSLASENVEQAIAVILSGTGSDGSRGAVALNAVDGFVIAQSPTQAGFDGMPNSVISTGVVDSVSDAQDIPKLVSSFIKSKQIPRMQMPKKNSEGNFSPEAQIDRITDKLFQEFGINFKLYKEQTLIRRIERRMQVKHVANFHTYADMIEKDPGEPYSLRKELLIPVTNFFRNNEIFSFIKENTLRQLVEKCAEGKEIRLWVAGCSTGEEAYSYAMLLESELKRYNSRANFKIFATDVNPDVVEFASKGCYPESVRKEIPDDIFERYFRVIDGKISISPEIRQRVVFAVHNLLSDAPFTKMDLVSCRNTLIYFKNEAQKEVLQRLQFAVVPNGFLVLGKSESVTVNSEFFEPLDRRYKIFVCNKKSPVSVASLNFAAQTKGGLGNAVKPFGAKHVLAKIESMAETQIRRCFTPLSLLVDQSHDVIHIFGDNTALLHMKPGMVSYQVANILPDKLSPVAVALLYRLQKEKDTITSDTVKLNEGGTEQSYQVKGWVVDNDSTPSHYVLSFVPVNDKRKSNKGSASLNVSEATLEKMHQLELELIATRESLQSTIEELETTNEELQATNEELMASNEELQSSNEELQSVNEELNTVNAEYHEKVSILNRINADLDAMSLSTGIATVFVDDKVNLTRFTPDASMIFKVREQDLGRPFNEIVNSLNYDSFFDDIELTLKTGRPKEVEILGRHGQGYLMRIFSYRLPSSDKFGAAISLIESKSFGTYHSVIDALPEHITVLDGSGNIVLVNEAWKRFALINGGNRCHKEFWVGSSYLDVCPDTVGESIRSVLSGEVDRFTFKYPCHSPTQKKWYVMEVRSIHHELYKAVVSHFDVSQWETDEKECSDTKSKESGA